jgi:hypothetical protein
MANATNQIEVPARILNRLESAVCKSLESVPIAERLELAECLARDIVRLQSCAEEARFLRMAGQSDDHIWKKYLGGD